LHAGVAFWSSGASLALLTIHADHKVWQDVYRPNTPAGDVYLKPTVVDDVLIEFFREL
jgi:motility quorum-sensing regulator/GCU-specific mRNA interferase toxin